MTGENLRVLFQRDEGVAAGSAWWSHQGGLEAAVGEFRDGLGVAVEPAIVLDLPVLHGAVEVEADEDALAVVEVVERLERGHGGCSNGRPSARKTG